MDTRGRSPPLGRRARVLYTGMSRAQDLLVVIADPAVVRMHGGEHFLLRLREESATTRLR